MALLIHMRVALAEEGKYTVGLRAPNMRTSNMAAQALQRRACAHAQAHARTHTMHAHTTRTLNTQCARAHACMHKHTHERHAPHVQIFYLSLFVFGLALVGAFYPYNRGALYSAIIVLYALTACIAGYVAASYYKQARGLRPSYAAPRLWLWGCGFDLGAGPMFWAPAELIVWLPPCALLPVGACGSLPALSCLFLLARMLVGHVAPPSWHRCWWGMWLLPPGIDAGGVYGSSLLAQTLTCPQQRAAPHTP